MKLKSCIILILVTFSTASAVPENVTANENATYNNHSICFEIPDGWYIYSDTEEGDNSSTILTDGLAAIRIDTVRLPEEELNNIVSSHLEEYNSKPWRGEKEPLDTNVPWLEVYRDYPWQVAGALLDIYMDQIERPSYRIKSGGSINLRLAGLKNFQEDCHVAISQNFGSGNTQDREKLPANIYPAEMYVVWTKPKYNNTFVAIRANFPDAEYETHEMKYCADFIYLWPKPLWDIIVTLEISYTEEFYNRSL